MKFGRKVNVPEVLMTRFSILVVSYQFVNAGRCFDDEYFLTPNVVGLNIFLVLRNEILFYHEI